MNDTIEMGKQMLVFVSSRSSAQKEPESSQVT